MPRTLMDAKDAMVTAGGNVNKEKATEIYELMMDPVFRAKPKEVIVAVYILPILEKKSEGV